MTRAFFDQVDDEVRGMIGSAFPGSHSARDARLIKLWWGDEKVHFEAQHVAPRWTRPVSDVAAVEVGLHVETPSAKQNDALLGSLGTSWKRKLPRAIVGQSLGPRAATWRRISELIPAPSLVDDAELASEVAACLYDYIRALQPLLEKVSADRP